MANITEFSLHADHDHDHDCNEYKTIQAIWTLLDIHRNLLQSTAPTDKTQGKHVLLVESEISIARIISLHLCQLYVIQDITIARSKEAAEHLLSNYQYDLIITYPVLNVPNIGGEFDIINGRQGFDNILHKNAHTPMLILNPRICHTEDQVYWTGYPEVENDVKKQLKTIEHNNGPICSAVYEIASEFTASLIMITKTIDQYHLLDNK